MTIHWSLLVPGALLLLFPADRLLTSRVELRSFERFRSLEDSPRHRPWWWVPALWLDPLRGFFGAFLLRESLEVALLPWEFLPPTQYAWVVVLLALGIVCQTFTARGEKGVMLAPMGFVAGVVVALLPWSVSLPVLVLAALGLFGLRQFHAFFSFGLAALVLFGVVFRAEFAWLALAAGALALPIVAGFLAGSSMELPTRDSSRPSALPPPAVKGPVSDGG
jgi:hypothetical protein